MENIGPLMRQLVIRKGMPSGHDPMGGHRFSEKIMLKQKDRAVFPRDKREAFARRSCSNKKIERDDDSKKSHPALVAGPACHRRLFLVVVGSIQASTIMSGRRAY